MQYRPVSEILNTNALRPQDTGSIMRNRRGGNRYACKFAAILSVNGKEYPVECLEISKGGMRVKVHLLPQFKPGQLVHVRLRIGVQNFGDNFNVIRHTRTAQGTTNVHLRLQDAQPAETDEPAKV
jgi:hypothetical protein